MQVRLPILMTGEHEPFRSKARELLNGSHSYDFTPVSFEITAHDKVLPKSVIDAKQKGGDHLITISYEAEAELEPLNLDEKKQTLSLKRPFRVVEHGQNVFLQFAKPPTGLLKFFAKPPVYIYPDSVITRKKHLTGDSSQIHD